MIALGETELTTIVPAILQAAREGEAAATLLYPATGVDEIGNDGLELELDHRPSSIAWITAVVSVRSVNTAAAPCAANSSVVYRPVATPIARAPMSRPHSMSAGVSPITTTFSPGTSIPSTSRARRCAIAGSCGRLS